MSKLLIVMFVILLLQFNLYAKGDFEWAPITEADWAIGEDATKGIRNAVMIFEKIVSDDRKLIDNRCYFELYHRLRILTSEGRNWADIVVPYLDKEQQVEQIYGRTVLPDNREILLDPSQIIEKEIFKTNDLKIKQKSFSLPAVSDDCIVEYYIKYRIPKPKSFILIEKEIYLIKGEYLWKFYRGKGVSNTVYSMISEMLTPNYAWFNTKKELKVEQRPSIKNAEEICFTIEDVPAFESEPHTLPDIALKAQIRCYYGGSGPPSAYWGTLSNSINKKLDEFSQKNKRVRKVVASFMELSSREEKVKAAYSWLQQNINNTTYDESVKKFKKNKCVDNVIANGYGTEEDINRVFYDMLREMNIDAKFAYAIDRDDNFFIQSVKSWQFDRSLVAVPGEGDKYDFYDPGGIYLPPGSIAWINEGTRPLVIGEMNKQFLVIPFSSSLSNRISRNQVLRYDENLNLKGVVAEYHTGHSARSIRLTLHQKTQKEKEDYLREKISESFSNSKADSFVVAGLDDLTKAVKVKYNIDFGQYGHKMGNRLLLKPYDLFSKHENPFQSTERKYIIMFDYAKEIIETLRITLPQNWSVEAFPADSAFSNDVGVCQILFKKFENENAISVQRLFKLNSPAWKQTGYPMIQQLFQSQQSFEKLTVILKKEQ